MSTALLDRPDVMAPTDPAVRDAYHRLTALQYGHVEGWYEYVGVDTPRYRRERIVVIGDVVRALNDNDLPWWVLGAADGNGRGDEVLAVLRQRTPDTVTLDEAADMLGVTGHALKTWINGGKLYPLHANTSARVRVAGPQRHVFAAQVGAILQQPAAKARWAKIRAKLPALTRVEHLPNPPQVTALPDPLPIADARWPKPQQQALMIGDIEGWFRYLGGQGMQANATFDVELGLQMRRTLPGPAVLPWVLGVADRWGHGQLVAYRRRAQASAARPWDRQGQG